MKTFTFKSENALAYKTLITQEMLKKGFLAATAVYACTAHSPAIIKEYLENLKPIFQMIKGIIFYAPAFFSINHP